MTTAYDLPPGIHPNIPFPLYLAIPAVNHSLLDKGLLSMAHLKASMATPSEPTDSTELGHALHMALFEPERFAVSVAEGPINTKTGECYGVGTKAWDEHAKGFPAGTLFMGNREKARINAMVSRLLAHPQARKLIQTPGPSEVVAIWIDKETGVKCKARMDKFIPSIVALDYKSARCAAPEQFAAAAASYGYHRQVAWYTDGFEAASEEATEYTLLVQESFGSFEPVLYRLEDEAVFSARTQNRALLRQYAECKRTGVWPGYPEGVLTLEFPKYAKVSDPEGLDTPMDDDPFSSRPDDSTHYPSSGIL